MDRPNTPHDEKLSVKLSLERIELLKESYKKHHNYMLVGRIFHVNPTTVRYWVDEEWKKRKLLKSTKHNMERIKNDPIFKNKVRVTKNRCAIDLRKRQPAIAQWEKDKSKEYRENNPEWAEYSRTKYLKNRDKILAKSKEKYWSNR